MSEEKSKYGFKDKAKALETLEILEEHDMNYRKLTVRGLLRNGKRVLSITKAPEKKKNIKEALEVFEKWLEDNGVTTAKKADSKKNDGSEDMDTSEKASQPDKVPGLGFKDPEAAKETLKNLEGRDPDYQKLALNGLLKSAKRVLTCTKDKTKLSNIKEAMKIFEDFLDDFDRKNKSKENKPYLPLDVVVSCSKLAKDRGVNASAQEKFIDAYKSVDGDYKRLRTVSKDNDKTWDIIRNKELKTILEKVKDKDLFDSKGQPTDEHLKLILWAYSPEDSKLKKSLGFDRKRKSDSSEVTDSKKSK